MAHTLDGVVLYEIFPDGCLNGTFSNDHPNGFITASGIRIGNRLFNEIARKIDQNNNDILNNPSALIGEYICSYIDLGGIVYECRLEISLGHIRRNRRACGYDFVWNDSTSGAILFEGSGWRIGNQIVVSYRDV